MKEIYEILKVSLGQWNEMTREKKIEKIIEELKTLPQTTACAAT